jgi:anti-anti-sigma factor
MAYYYYYYRLPPDVDIDTACKLRSELLAVVNAGQGDVIVDCVYLQFIESVGVAVIGQIRRLLAVHDRALRLINLGPRARRSFELFGLADYIEVGEAEPA